MSDARVYGLTTGCLVTARRTVSPAKRIEVHVKKYKPLRETEFFLENSVSVAQSLNMSQDVLPVFLFSVFSVSLRLILGDNLPIKITDVF